MAVQHKLLVPSSIDIVQILTSLGYGKSYINTHQDKYHYILHKILEQRLFDSRIERDGYSPLHLDTLRGLLGRRYAGVILKELVDLNIIQCDSIKLYGNQGSKAYAYRIHPDYVSKSKLHPVVNPVFDKKLRHAAYCYKQQWSKSTPWKNLQQLGIHAPAAVAFVDAKLDTSLMMLQEYGAALQQVIDKSQLAGLLKVYREVYDSYSAKEDRFREKHTESGSTYPFRSLYSLIPVQLMEKEFQKTHSQGVVLDKCLQSLFVNKHAAEVESIGRIAQKKFFLEQPDPSSRLFTNLSNLSGELRQFLFHRQYHGMLVNLDIRNSQPYLLSLLLRDHYAGQPLPATAREYIRLTATGEFYEYMMEKMGIDPAAITKRKRSAFKKTFFAKIFFCTSHYSRRTPEGKVFRRHFKEVADLVDAYKANGHKQLAITMQRREAEIILKVIGSALHQRGIWFATIHDSVVVKQEHEEVARELILESFSTAVGVAPTVTPEYLTSKREKTQQQLSTPTDSYFRMGEQEVELAFDEQLEQYEATGKHDFFG